MVNPQNANTLNLLQRLDITEPFVWLYEIEVPTDPPTRYRLCGQYTEEITFRGNTYYPFPITHSSDTEDTEANLPEVGLTVANVSRELMTTISTYGGLIGQPVRIMLVNTTDLESNTAVTQQDFQIRNLSFNEESVTANLALYNLYRTTFPRNRLMRGHCRFAYRGIQCGYSIAVSDGGLAECDKSLDGPNGCEAHGTNESTLGFPVIHPARFGGAPSIPRQQQGGTL